MKSYRALKNIWIRGKILRRDEVIKLTEESSKELLERKLMILDQELVLKKVKTAKSNEEAQ